MIKNVFSYVLFLVITAICQIAQINIFDRNDLYYDKQVL